MTIWKGPEVDKLFANKVLVTCVKAAEDLDLSPVISTVSTSVANTMLHAPQQQSNITAIELLVG